MPLPRVLFRSPLNSGLCISETLDLKITDGRLVEGAAKSARVIAKGDQERIMPLPGSPGCSSKSGKIWKSDGAIVKLAWTSYGRYLTPDRATGNQ